MRKRSEAAVPATAAKKAELGCPECGHLFTAVAFHRAGGTLCPKCHAEVDVVAEQKLDTVCEDCGTPQRMTPSGATCDLGHGGAGGITPAQWAAKLKAASRGAMRETPVNEAPAEMSNPGYSSASVSGVGEVVEVTWGEEVFSPKQYNSFRVGPFSASTRVCEGETRVQAMARLNAALAAFAEEAFEQKRVAFLRALKRAGDAGQ